MKNVKIGGASAFLGDTSVATPQLLQVDSIDYLVYDFLAEATMGILAQARTRNPVAGYAADFIDVVRRNVRQIEAGRVRLVANAGGMNPAHCAEALREALAAAGSKLKVGFVAGDDLLPRYQDGPMPEDMYKRTPVRGPLTSANAYVGAEPVARCLGLGADIVVTGRCVDSALVLGILLHEFGWDLSNFDLMAQGTLCGHLLECGAQATGGTFTDWYLGGDWSNIGYPFAEVSPDGSFVIAKPGGTGGLVSRATVAEQMVYEIDDPAAYVVPDVVCDFTQVEIEELDGSDRVRVSGARGYAPPDSFKVSATARDGFRTVVIHPVVGMDAAAKARKQADALVRRAEALIREDGFEPFSSVYVELLGAEATYGANAAVAVPREIVSKIVLDHPRREALELFTKESAAPVTSMAPGSTSWHGGRPVTSHVMRVASFLVPKRDCPATVSVENHSETVMPRLFHGGVTAAGTYSQVAAQEYPGTRFVRLVDLAWARSGDKGDRFMVGVIARRPEYLPYIKAALQTERLKRFMEHVFDDPAAAVIDRYDWHGIAAVQLVFQNAQHGGTLASPRLDPLSKAMGQQLLELEVAVPLELEVESYASRRDRLARN